MASKLLRVLQRRFGSSGTTGEFGEFGSLQTGSKITTKDPAAIQSLSNFLVGWLAAVVTVGDQPQVVALEDLNGLFLVAFHQIGYILQQGMPEYDATTEYFQNSFCQVSGAIYKSLTDNNIGNTPSSSPSNWTPILSTTPNGYLNGGLVQNDTIDPINGLTITATYAKDSQNLFLINAATLTKKVSSTWAAGNNNGALDAGSIGGVPCKVYVFAIGKTTDPTAGEYLFSKSRTAPDMTLPNAAGFNIRRLIGQRYWDGSKFSQFVAAGNGNQKTVILMENPKVLNAGGAGSFADVDISQLVDGVISRRVFLAGVVTSSGNSPACYLRPKGSGAAIGNSTLFLIGSAFFSESLNTISGYGDIVINTAAIFQYAAPSHSLDLYLRGYVEDL